MSLWTERSRGLVVLAAAALATGCRQDMHDQPRYEPLEASAFFEDGSSARAPVEGTVPWGASPLRPDRALLREDVLLYTGRSGAGPGAPFGTSFPFEITAPDLDRGQARFDIYCSVCHGQLGTGEGMVARRGFRRPPTYHSDRLRAAPPGYVFDVITRGFGAMPSYADRIPVRDRWLIVAYVRALQLSQNARLSDVPPEHRPLPGS
jgi:mono/diheme cytochrome c family protein